MVIRGSIGSAEANRESNITDLLERLSNNTTILRIFGVFILFSFIGGILSSFITIYFARSLMVVLSQLAKGDPFVFVSSVKTIESNLYISLIICSVLFCFCLLLLLMHSTLKTRSNMLFEEISDKVQWWVKSAKREERELHQVDAIQRQKDSIIEQTKIPLRQYTHHTHLPLAKGVKRSVTMYFLLSIFFLIISGSASFVGLSVPLEFNNLLNINGWEECYAVDGLNVAQEISQDVDVVQETSTSDSVLTFRRMSDEGDEQCWHPFIYEKSDYFSIVWEVSIEGRAAILNIGEKENAYLWFSLLPNESLIGRHHVSKDSKQWTDLRSLNAELNKNGEPNKFCMVHDSGFIEIIVNDQTVDIFEDDWLVENASQIQLGLGIAVHGGVDTTVKHYDLRYEPNKNLCN